MQFITLLRSGVVVMTALGLAAGAAEGNPLLAKWSAGPGGTIPFDRVRVADFAPALEAAMRETIAQIDAITANPAPPTFENTILAFERTGETFRRVNAIYGVWTSTMNVGDFQAVETEMEPKLAAHQDRIYQNPKLFARIEAVYHSPHYAALTPVQRRLTWVDYNAFVRAGAALDAAAKGRVAQINERLATLFTRFSQNLLADEADYVLYLKDDADLDGLPGSLRAAAAAAAASRGHAGEWAITNTRSSMDPFLTYSKRRDLREQVWRTYYSRCDHGDAHDNKAIITEILALRAERAKLLGFPTHAHFSVADGMAKDPQRAVDLLMRLWVPAVRRERREVADMQALADAEHAGIKIEAWDYRYYSEKVRKRQFDFDMESVKPYLQLEKLREGMFWAAGRLYGFQFTPLQGLPVPHPDVRVWEVKNAAGTHVGLWYFDPYARPGKNSGAWMSEYRAQNALGHVAAIVSNNTNFVKGEGGEPVLISWADAVALFHEFGHALHGLSSAVPYPSLAGTSTVTDFVEFPSQLNENWLSTPEVLERFALHYQTGRPIPAELLAKLKATENFNRGFADVEYLASALVDMKIHMAGEAPIDPDAFERTTLAALGMPAEMVMRHRTPQFAHIFSSDAYASGYYAYLWAETLARDAFEAFTGAEGPYDKAVAKRYFDSVLSVGNSVDAGDAYRNFRGRDSTVDALLRAHGYAENTGAAAVKGE
jgi:peptidyl-dipeptidase Dcp